MTNAERDGVAAATVIDGHVIVFMKSRLEEIMAKLGDKDRIVIFVKRPDMSG